MCCASVVELGFWWHCHPRCQPNECDVNNRTLFLRFSIAIASSKVIQPTLFVHWFCFSRGPPSPVHVVDLLAMGHMERKWHFNCIWNQPLVEGNINRNSAEMIQKTSASNYVKNSRVGALFICHWEESTFERLWQTASADKFWDYKKSSQIFLSSSVFWVANIGPAVATEEFKPQQRRSCWAQNTDTCTINWMHAVCIVLNSLCDRNDILGEEKKQRGMMSEENVRMHN